MSCGCSRSYGCCGSNVAPITLADITRSDANVGETPVWDGDNWVPGVPDLSGVAQYFDELSDVLSADTGDIIFAYTRNYDGTDGTKQLWLKITDSGLSDNGTDVRESDDGSKFLRIFSRGG